MKKFSIKKVLLVVAAIFVILLIIGGLQEAGIISRPEPSEPVASGSKEPAVAPAKEPEAEPAQAAKTPESNEPANEPEQPEQATGEPASMPDSTAPAGGASEPAESKTEIVSDKDRKATLMVVAKKCVEKYVSGVKYSNDIDDWVFVDTDGRTSVSTHVTIGGEDQRINVITRIKDDNKSFETYFVEVGGTVYLDTLPEGA